jgi:hypothetical protein
MPPWGQRMSPRGFEEHPYSDARLNTASPFGTASYRFRLTEGITHIR